MRKELLQVVYNNGLLWYLLRGVNDCLSDSVDDTSAKKNSRRDSISPAGNTYG